MTIFESFTIDFNKFFPPIIYILIGVISYQIIKKTINHLAESKKKLKKRHYQKRAETIKTISLNVIKYIIIIIVIIAVLPSFGVNVGAMVAGLGVTAALIGLAFQDIAKDLLAGISIVAEDQYEIGDTIEVNGFKGEVVFVGLRSTRIRDYRGATKIIANHRITELVNYNLHNSLAIVDVRIPLIYSPEEIEKVLDKMTKSLAGKIEKAKGPVQVLGLEHLDNTAMVYRIAVEVSPLEHYKTERFLRKEVKKALDKAEIKM